MSRCIFAILLALAGPVYVAAAETITVCASGCDYTSISDAVYLAENGDVIQILPGDYSVFIPIDVSGRRIEIRGPARIFGANDGPILICNSKETNQTVFQDLTLVAYPDSDLVYIYESDPVFLNCKFYGSTVSCFSGSPYFASCKFGEAISIDGPSSSHFVGCEFSERGVPQIFSCDSAEFFICRFKDMWWPLEVFPWIGSVRFTECSFEDNRSHVLYLYGNSADSLHLSSCSFVGNDRTSIMIETGRPAIEDCSFLSCCDVYPPRSIIDLGGNDYESWCNDCRENIDCRNNAVDAEDLAYLLAGWGTDDPQCDLDGNGVVGAADLGFIFAAWGPCQ